MFCPKCGTDIDDSSIFCRNCGVKIQAEFKKPKYQILSWAVPITIFVGGVILLIVLVNFQLDKKTPVNTLTQTTQQKPVPAPTLIPIATPTPVPTPYFVHNDSGVGHEAFTLAPGQYRAQPIIVKSEWKNFRLWAKFRAQGGGGNDVAVLLLDDDNLENWKNNHGYYHYYESGKVTVGTIDVKLAPGKYWLVTSNRMSVFANKAVNFDSRVEFDVLHRP